MKRSTELSFYISSQYLSALINGDYSGLGSQDLQTVEDFHNYAHSQCPNGFEWGHFSVTNDETDLRECEASDKLADCVEVTAIFWKV